MVQSRVRTRGWGRERSLMQDEVTTLGEDAGGENKQETKGGFKPLLMARQECGSIRDASTLKQR